MIAADLLEILACPECRTRLHLHPQQSSLKCERCFRVFPILDDIPILLLDQAVVEPPA